MRYWTAALGVSKEELAALVEEHGNAVSKIRAAPDKRPPPKP